MKFRKIVDTPDVNVRTDPSVDMSREVKTTTVIEKVPENDWMRHSQ